MSAYTQIATSPDPFSPVNWESERETFAAADELVALALETLPANRLRTFAPHFEILRSFCIPATTFTPMMLYGLYSMAAAMHARRVVVCGVDAGTSTAALAAGASYASPAGISVTGSERNPALAALARENLARLVLPQEACILAASAASVLSSVAPASVDLIFLDTWPEDHPALLHAVLSALAPGGLLLAHDPLLPRCVADFEKMSAAVSATGAFQSIVLPLDEMGLYVARHTAPHQPCA